MFQGKVPSSTNAVDGGDTILIRPSHRTNDGNVPKKDSRLFDLIEQATSFRSMQDIHLSRKSLSGLSFMYDAQDRTAEENYLGQQQSRGHQRDLFPVIEERFDSKNIKRKGFLDEYSTDVRNHEKQRRMGLRIFCLLFLLTCLVVIAVVVVGIHKTQMLQNEPKTLTPGDQSTPIPKASPSIANNRTFDSIVNFLRTVTTVDDQHFQDTTKPQHQAISWMADIDTFAYSIPESKKDDGYFDFVQRYALAVLFYATNGRKWDNSSYFLKSTHACSWNYEIPFIGNETMKVGVTCDRMKEVTALIMRTYTTA